MVITPSCDRSASKDSPPPLSREILRAVADAENVSPVELTPPLYTAIDPDALDSLFVNTDEPMGKLKFTYHGYEINVYNDGTVNLQSTDQ